MSEQLFYFEQYSQGKGTSNLFSADVNLTDAKRRYACVAMNNRREGVEYGIEPVALVDESMRGDYKIDKHLLKLTGLIEQHYFGEHILFFMPISLVLPRLLSDMYIKIQYRLIVNNQRSETTITTRRLLNPEKTEEPARTDPEPKRSARRELAMPDFVGEEFFNSRITSADPRYDHRNFRMKLTESNKFADVSLFMKRDPTPGKYGLATTVTANHDCQISGSNDLGVMRIPLDDYKDDACHRQNCMIILSEVADRINKRFISFFPSLHIKPFGFPETAIAVARKAVRDPDTPKLFYEEKIFGRVVRHTQPSGAVVSDKNCADGQQGLALMHASYEITNGQQLLSSIHEVKSGKPVYHTVEPSVANRLRSRKQFGENDHGKEAITGFERDHLQCGNIFCYFAGTTSISLGLSEREQLHVKFEPSEFQAAEPGKKPIFPHNAINCGFVNHFMWIGARKGGGPRAVLESYQLFDEDRQIWIKVSAREKLQHAVSFGSLVAVVSEVMITEKSKNTTRKPRGKQPKVIQTKGEDSTEKAELEIDKPFLLSIFYEEGAHKVSVTLKEMKIPMNTQPLVAGHPVFVLSLCTEGNKAFRLVNGAVQIMETVGISNKERAEAVLMSLDFLFILQKTSISVYKINIETDKVVFTKESDLELNEHHYGIFKNNVEWCGNEGYLLMNRLDQVGKYKETFLQKVFYDGHSLQAVQLRKPVPADVKAEKIMDYMVRVCGKRVLGLALINNTKIQLWEHVGERFQVLWHANKDLQVLSFTFNEHQKLGIFTNEKLISESKLYKTSLSYMSR